MPCIRINTPNVAAQTIEQETVIIHFGSGMYYNTDAVGAVIWSLIDGGTTAENIEEELARQYDGDREEIARSMASFVEELRQEGLVVLDDSDTVAAPRSVALPSASVAAPRSVALPSVSERPAFTTPILNRYTDMAELLLLDPVHEIEDRRVPAQAPATL